MTDDELDHALLYYSDREAWHAAENAKLVAASEVEPDDLDDMAALMQEDVVGANHGSVSAQLTYREDPAHDGLAAPSTRRSLNTETREARQFARSGAATVVHRPELTWYGAVSHLRPGDGNRTLTPAEVGKLDQTRVRAAVLDRLGVTEEEMHLLDTTVGRLGPETRAIQARVDEKLLQVQDAGGRVVDLARALGWSVAPGRASQRMTMCLRRARKRRAEATIAAAA